MRRGQSISEHYSVHNNKHLTQSTYMTWSNIIGFNTGYHNEHHTLNNVAWRYLPNIKKEAFMYFTQENKTDYICLWYEWLNSDLKKDYYRVCH